MHSGTDAATPRSDQHVEQDTSAVRRLRHLVADSDAAALSTRVGNAVRHLRERRGLTQFELAGTVNCDQACISQIERGRRRQLNLVLAAAIAFELGTDLDQLLNFPDEEEAP